MTNVLEIIAPEDCRDGEWNILVGIIASGTWHGLPIGNIRIDYHRVLVEVKVAIKPLLIAAIKTEPSVGRVTVHKSSYIEGAALRYIA